MKLLDFSNFKCYFSKLLKRTLVKIGLYCDQEHSSFVSWITGSAGCGKGGLTVFY